MLQLPLTDETANVLIEYLRKARPESGRRELFLRSRAPLTPEAFLMWSRPRSPEAYSATRLGVLWRQVSVSADLLTARGHPPRLWRAQDRRAAGSRPLSRGRSRGVFYGTQAADGAQADSGGVGASAGVLGSRPVGPAEQRADCVLTNTIHKAIQAGRLRAGAKKKKIHASVRERLNRAERSRSSP